MSRNLTLLFRRDPSRDRQSDKARFEGYQTLWPDGRPVSVGVDALCVQGQRLLGLGRCLAGCQEKLVKMVLFPLSGIDDDLNRIPGYRVRRFYIALTGAIGRLHFMDGTPTLATFDVYQDDPRILRWLGLSELCDGEVVWFDLAAVGADAAITSSPRLRTVEACERLSKPFLKPGVS
jgi:hypothetical protein